MWYQTKLLLNGAGEMALFDLQDPPRKRIFMNVVLWSPHLHHGMFVLPNPLKKKLFTLIERTHVWGGTHAEHWTLKSNYNTEAFWGGRSLYQPASLEAHSITKHNPITLFHKNCDFFRNPKHHAFLAKTILNKDFFLCRTLVLVFKEEKSHFKNGGGSDLIVWDRNKVRAHSTCSPQALTVKWPMMNNSQYLLPGLNGNIPHFTATNEAPPPISHGPFQSGGCQ